MKCWLLFKYLPFIRNFSVFSVLDGCFAMWNMCCIHSVIAHQHIQVCPWQENKKWFPLFFYFNFALLSLSKAIPRQNIGRYYWCFINLQTKEAGFLTSESFATKHMQHWKITTFVDIWFSPCAFWQLNGLDVPFFVSRLLQHVYSHLYNNKMHLFLQLIPMWLPMIQSNLKVSCFS